MFEGIVIVLDKAIELINIRQKNDKEFFSLVISPLFIEFEKVAESYFKLFNNCGTRKSQLIEIRNQYLKSRIKVTELAKIYGENVEDIAVLEYFNAIQEFFFVSPTLEKDIGGSGGSYFIDLVTGETERVKLTGGITKKKEELKKNMEIKWGRVVSIYGELQMKYGLPIGYKA